MMIECNLQPEPIITGNGETNDDNKGFLGEREEQEIEKSLIDYFPRQIFVTDCGGGCWFKARW